MKFHIETQTFSAVSAVNFSNNVFSSTYDNYKIIFRKNSASTPNQPILRFRVAGVDNTASEYERQQLEGFSSTLSTARITTNLIPLSNANSNINTSIIEIINPFLTTKTNLFFSNNDETTVLSIFHAMHTSTTSFDSVNFTVSSGNITGYMSVYGYRK